MPVIIVGADTPTGEALASRFAGGGGAVRAFVSDFDAAVRLRQLGLQVATGDVSDDSHISGACLGCFTVVLVAEAATDGRDRSFANSSAEVLASWARAAEAAGVRRLIWISDRVPPEAAKVPEVAVLEPGTPDLVEAVFRLDEAREI